MSPIVRPVVSHAGADLAAGGKRADEIAPRAAADELLSFLGDPSTYPHGPATVEIVQTHASFVALAGELVYKVKKPVSLGFLDFSTLTARRHFCEEEVRLNRRLCPGVYRGVVAITRRAGRLAWGGPGDPVEYAVEMERLTPEGFLDGRLERGQASGADMDRVADVLAEFYREQEPSPRLAEWGRPERLRLSTDENAEQIAPFVGDLLGRPAFEAIGAATERFFGAHARTLEARRASGRILDGHGDLHVEHVHIDPAGQVRIYDCIEFSERLRHIDVAADVAFLAMDLDFRGRADLASRFSRRVSILLHDPGMHQVLGFYKGYRACVRGKVEGMRAMDVTVSADGRAASRERARRYFRLAAHYAVAGSAPLVVVVMGRVGTGKSVQARALADALGYEVVSSDRVRKEAAGVDLTRRGSASERAELYSRERTEATYAALAAEACSHVAEGRGVVLDATYALRRHRDGLRTALAAAGVAHRFVELQAPESAIIDRLVARGSSVEELSDARLEDLPALQALYEQPDAFEDPDHFVADTAVGPEETTGAILACLVRVAS